MNSQTLRKKIILFALPIQFIVYYLLSLSTSFVDTFYLPYVFTPVTYLLRITFHSIPFPVGQFLYYSALIFIFYALVKSYLHHRKSNDKRALRKQYLHTSLKYISIFYFVYIWVWGFNYHRTPLSDKLNLDTENITTQEIKELCIELIQNTNTLKNQLKKDTLSIDSIFNFSAVAYTKAQKQILDFNLTTPSIKKILAPKSMSWYGLSGIYFPFTAEANINTDMLRFKVPFIVCHELAHQVGYASESEANFISFLVCQASNNPHFQYSSNYDAMRYALNTLKQIDSTQYYSLDSLISEEVRADIKNNNTYWKQFESPIRGFNHWFYDLFLKANQQKNGIKSYGLMIELLIGEKRKTNLSRFIP